MPLSRFLDLAVLGLLAWGALLAAMRWRTPLATRRARVVWGASIALWAVAWLATTPAVSLGLIGLLEPSPTPLATLDDPTLRGRTALVVLSSSSSPPTPGDTPLERLDAAGTARTIGAARVWRALHTGAVIVTGRAPGTVPEATVEAMRDLLVMHGVPRDRILLEPWALNTRQNALHAVRLGRRLGFTRFVAVTSALHMPRALREFRRAGVEAAPAPVQHVAARHGGLSDWLPTSWGLGATHAALHELLGMLKP
jgi:uncharacterized SAM-binding protein YcdF (DUF218 family)